MLQKLVKLLKLQKEKGNVIKIPLHLIKSNPYQPRREYDEKALTGLIESIKEHGVLQPIILRRKETTKEEYEIVCGERRVLASRKAGLKEIPAIIGSFTDGEVLEIALLENLQRKNLTVMEEAIGYDRLSSFVMGDTREEVSQKIAKRISKNSEEVYNRLLLLSLPVILRKAIDMGIITPEHAEVLKELPDEEAQVEIIEKIKKEKLSLRETKELTNKLAQFKKYEKDEEGTADVLKIFSQVIDNSTEILKNIGLKVVTEYQEKDDSYEIKIKISK